jgi:hypothetical protein
MRSIDDIIADACQTAAGALREAFALGGVERAVELKARFETVFLDGPVAPASEVSANDPIVVQRERSRREEPEPRRPPKPRPRAILLGVIAILTLALCHARAARLLPAYALLIGLGALLRDWSEDGPPA